MGPKLQLLSGLFALAAAGLLGYRVWTVAPPPALAALAPPPPAVYSYAPPPQPVKSGDVHETESPANGFIVVVETTPEQSELFVNDVQSGETPASINYVCKPGDTYRLALKHDGYETLRHEITCKKDVMLIVTAKLQPLRRR
jgi:hypothetical protein